MKKYLIIVEETQTGFSAYSPDVPGCGSTGKTKEEVERNIQEAIEFHLEGLREEGYEIPEPSSYSSYIEVAAYEPRLTTACTRPATRCLSCSCNRSGGRVMPGVRLH